MEDMDIDNSYLETAKESLKSVGKTTVKNVATGANEALTSFTNLGYLFISISIIAIEASNTRSKAVTLKDYDKMIYDNLNIFKTKNEFVLPIISLVLWFVLICYYFIFREDQSINKITIGILVTSLILGLTYLISTITNHYVKNNRFKDMLEWFGSIFNYLQIFVILIILFLNVRSKGSAKMKSICLIITILAFLTNTFCVNYYENDFSTLYTTKRVMYYIFIILFGLYFNYQRAVLSIEPYMDNNKIVEILFLLFLSIYFIFGLLRNSEIIYDLGSYILPIILLFLLLVNDIRTQGNNPNKLAIYVLSSFIIMFLTYIYKNSTNTKAKAFIILFLIIMMNILGIVYGSNDCNINVNELVKRCIKWFILILSISIIYWRDIFKDNITPLPENIGNITKSLADYDAIKYSNI